MASAINRKLGFFKDCLAAESRAQIVWNYPTPKSQHNLEIETAKSSLILGKREAKKFSQTLERYTRERHLLLHSGFINGPYGVPSFAGSRRRRQISCPIFIYPCELADWNRVNVDITRSILNPAAIDILQQFGISADDLFLELESKFAEEAGETLNTKGHEFLLSIHALFLIEIKRLLSELSKAELALDISAQLSVEPKVASAQGSLYELEALCDRRSFSMPVKQILGEYKSPMALYGSSDGFWSKLFSRSWSVSRRELPLPEALSDAQANVLKCAKRYPLSVVSGPPGTGKSFTIACLALSEFSQGNSVLVVSQNQHAADVVRRKLIDDMGIDAGLTMLASEKGASGEAKSQLKLMLRRKYEVTPKSIVSHRKKLFSAIDDLLDLEREYQSRIEEIGLRDKGERSKRDSLWKRFWGGDTSLDLPFHDLFLKLEDHEKSIKKQIVALIKLEYELTAKMLAEDPVSRQSLSAFAASLTAKDEHYQERYYKSVKIDHALKAVPLWFSAVGNLNRFVPNEREMFDLVIIDEATQCNLSVCLPALQRAKRAVIVGDVKQLKHVSFVSYDVQQSLAEQYNLNDTTFNTDFRNTSVLEYAIDSCGSGSQSVQLDEHFRSHPQIIEFSNREFYDGELRIMTERPTNRQQSINVIKTNGERLNKGVNKKEAQELLAYLQEIIQDQADLPETEVHEIGVLAFFSAQATYLEKLIFDEVSLNNIRRHNIRIGNPFSFQGEERDHMLISCSVDANTAAGSYNYLNRDDVFNVAITRARDYQTLFISCTPEQIRANSKLASYLKFVEEYKVDYEQDSQPKKDAFQAEICEWLSKRGAQAFPNFLVAGMSIDIMAVYHGRAIAIDLVGFPGELEGALSLTQFRMLQRAGLDSFILSYQDWKDNPEPPLKALMLQLGVSFENEKGHDALDKYSEVDERYFAEITGGTSINKLHARFIKHDEIVAAEQLATLVTQAVRYKNALQNQFQVGELTYKRYLNAFQDSAVFCVKNLSQAAITAELSNDMFEQHKIVFGESQFNNEFDDVIAARLSLIDEQRARFKSLIKENETALLQIDRTLIKLNSLDDDTDQIDPTEALNELTERLELYRGNTHNNKA